ncbi:ATP-dependent endonuclease [Nocardia sp. NPDC059091]|uniref:ATP-dependent nuclease n=1 Tax=Nocardia sp. NPDC059091 TaxID=3346724 RepID=UPI0036792A34
MYVESVTVRNFQCFGPEPTRIELLSGLTVFIGNNGAGKTAVMEALLRLFGVTDGERRVRSDDFHVPIDESESPLERSLTVEAVLAFPELDEDESSDTVAEFFRQMAATVDGQLKCRIVLEASWIDDGSIDGAITAQHRVVFTFDEAYGDHWRALSAADRSRIQMLYVPASRDGARQVSQFLRGRLWRAAKWSESLAEQVRSTAEDLATNFRDEATVKVVEDRLTRRWQELHTAGSDTVPSFQPIDSDFSEIVRNADLLFTPGAAGRPRHARFLSDGQRSLLHLALTATALDIEAEVVAGNCGTEFNAPAIQPPALTLLAVEEPENSLAPFYLSRIVGQLGNLCAGSRAQAVMSSHSASVLARVEPEQLRYFRTDAGTATASVRSIRLPDDSTEAGKYVREAVRAHPELYFARFVVLGEGDSEQLVIPLLAQAREVTIDRSFVAVVPLGGRHTNHFWRLLNDLDIPHATLLDYDLGRDGGGPGRLRDVCRELAAIGKDPFDGIDRYDNIEDLIDSMPAADCEQWREHLREWNVFFSWPLDLDMSLLQTYWAHYTRLEPGERGPHDSDATVTVLGKTGLTNEYWNPDDQVNKDRRHKELRWYRYLFKNRSKPSTHLRALANTPAAELASPPDSLADLITRIAEETEW